MLGQSRNKSVSLTRKGSVTLASVTAHLSVTKKTNEINVVTLDDACHAYLGGAVRVYAAVVDSTSHLPARA